MTTDLIDEDDGENRAVRMFLALYGCNPGTTVGQMRQHLTMSGFPHWPEWVDEVSQAGHLTKGGAQHWLRHLFALEPPTEAQLVAGLIECEPLGELIDWREGFGRDEMRAVWAAMRAAV